jgi:hypothetical protein
VTGTRPDTVPEHPSQQAWAPYLDAGERLLWEGYPSQRLFVLTKQDAVLIPFSILWGGFALFWNVGVWVAGAPLFFSLFGLPFLAVGAYMTVGRFYHDRYLRRHTVYALTDRRAFIASSAFGKRTLRDKQITAMTRIDYTQGTEATLAFDPSAASLGTSRSATSFAPGGTGDFTFRLIPDGDPVYRLVRDIQRASA